MASPDVATEKRVGIQGSQVGDRDTQEGRPGVARLKGTVADQRDMARMSKVQETRRIFNRFTMFGFSLILVASWETILGAAAIALGNGGTSGYIYTFIGVWIGFLATYTSMAELGSMCPTSGGQYHWVSEFAPRSLQQFLSYIVGWLGVLGWQTGVAFTAYIAGTEIQALLVLNHPDYVFERWHGTLLIIAIALLSVVFNTFLATKLHIAEGIILFIHVFGFLCILVPLLALSPRASSKDVWMTFNNPGWESTGLSALIGMVASVASLLGADSAAHMAEEIRDASFTLPRMMVWSTVANGFMGFAMILALCYSIGDIATVLETPTGYAFIQVFYNSTQSLPGTNAMTALIIILETACCITIMAGASRQMWAFARDQGLPFSKWLAYVRPGYDVPINTVIVSFAFTTIMALINIGSTVAFNSIASLGTGTLTLSYIVCISCVVWRRLTRQPLLPSRFDLGASGLYINLFSVAFLVLILAISFFPPVPLPYLDAVSMNWSVLIWGVVLIWSIVYFVIWGRFRYVGPVEYVRVLDG